MPEQLITMTWNMLMQIVTPVPEGQFMLQLWSHCMQRCTHG